MDPEYARRYRELYDQHWWWRAREAFLLTVLRRHRPPAGWRRILDVGSGDGLLFDRLAEFGDVEGVEADAALIDPASKHRARIHVGPFDSSFRPERRYSLILMLDLLEHLPAPAAGLRHAVALLEPGGVVVATVPAFGLLWTMHDELNHHFRRYTKASFAALAAAAGLEIESATYFFHWLFLAKLLVRGAEHVTHAHPTPPETPAPWLNGALYGLTRLEQRILTPLRVPFGSSLLIVGRSAAHA